MLRSRWLLSALAATLLACSESPTDAPQATDEARPTFEPGTHRIAFVSNRDGLREGYVYVARDDGTDVTRLVTGYAPAWSWDGRRIAFTRSGSGGIAPLFSVLVLEADGSQRVLAEGRDPSWSPDDQQIVFARSDGLYTIRTDGTGGVRKLIGVDTPVPRNPLYEPGSHEGAYLSSPTWSPDGRSIAFVRQDLYNFDWGATYSVYVINADGSAPRLVTAPAESTHPAKAHTCAQRSTLGGRRTDQDSPSSCGRRWEG